MHHKKGLSSVREENFMTKINSVNITKNRKSLNKKINRGKIRDRLC